MKRTAEKARRVRIRETLLSRFSKMSTPEIAMACGLKQQDIRNLLRANKSTMSSEKMDILEAWMATRVDIGEPPEADQIEAILSRVRAATKSLISYLDRPEVGQVEKLAAVVQFFTQGHDQLGNKRVGFNDGTNL